MNQIQKTIPPEQAIWHVIQKALLSFQWLKELDIAWHIKMKNKKDGSKIRRQQEIILDVFSVYIGSLFDATKGTHSLVRSFATNDFIEQFYKNPYVKMCIKHRNNRAGHQSKKYGAVASLDVVLASHLDEWLHEASYLVGMRKMIRK